VYAVPGNVTTKNAWGPNTLIKQGAKLTATWEDVWEDLPSQVRLALEDEMAERLGVTSGSDESSAGTTASLFDESGKAGSEVRRASSRSGFVERGAMPLGEHERLVLEQLRVDESLQLDELIERLESKVSSGEIFTALFELELAGRVRSMPGKNYVRCL
jgi:DNA processing protein